jgi:actin related protein 2/3 complex subunit 5
LGKTQDDNFTTVQRVLSNLSDSDVAAIVNAVDLEQADALMKYIYRMLAVAENCGTMLKLHAALTEKAGAGAIVRALADRRTV